jgi:hypothetical protein
MNQSQSKSTPRKVALALQGGGSHGAFTWGVLDRMLEDEAIDHYRRHRHQCRSHECHCARRRDGSRGPEARPQRAPPVLGGDRQNGGV